jgi:hypothetical protein
MHFSPALTLLLATLVLAAPSPAPVSDAVTDMLTSHMLVARNCECFDECSDKCQTGGGCMVPGCNGLALLGW